MGNKKITLTMPTDFQDGQLQSKITKQLKTKEFTYRIEKKSLDARKKNNIRWQLQVTVFSDAIKTNDITPSPALEIPYKKRDKKAVVIGSGPAGFFSALVLQKAGFKTTILERGGDVDTREKGIAQFEKTACFNPMNNYAFGEGGAGTFSDGKLTSRSKHISKEKQFILESYIRAGAPEEIAYLAHPHLGSDNLKNIVKNLRETFISLGGTVQFETILEDISVKDGKVTKGRTSAGDIEGDIWIIASGHSAFETYRMLISKGVPFRTKNFAIGCRVEHPQEIINRAQWGKESIPGVKAAEYRLTSNKEDRLPVYTFCMCPGGIIVPAAAYGDTNIVNGMSLYNRDNRFANAACVAGVNLEKLQGREFSALETLDWLESLERSFFEYTTDYKAPYCEIGNFIGRKGVPGQSDSSYPMGLSPAPLWEYLPPQVSRSISEGLVDFSRKLKGFDTGLIMGLESKTSAPIQVVREQNGPAAGFENLYIVGEGSGYAGGIISSAADGIKTVLNAII